MTVAADAHIPYPQMNQAKLFENEYLYKTDSRRRKYGRSQHYHYVADVHSYETFSGTRMVFSSIIEMLSNVSMCSWSLKGSPRFLVYLTKPPFPGVSCTASKSLTHL